MPYIIWGKKVGLHSKTLTFKPQSHIHGFGPGRATVHPDHRDESGWKSINTVSHDAPTVSARFV